MSSHNQGDARTAIEEQNTQKNTLSSLTLPLAILGWPIAFGLFIWMAEPYGYRIDRSETKQMWLTFGVGWPLWAITIFFMAGGNLFKSVLRTSGITKNAFKAGTKRKITAVQTAELNEYINVLKGADDEELGVAVATALHLAEKYKIETGIDLFQPMSAIQQSPDITFEFASEIEKAQAAKEAHRSTPLLVWAHTLRGFSNPALRLHARKMWAELSRVFPYAATAAGECSIIFGEPLQIDRLGEFPDGLNPNQQRDVSSSVAPKIESELMKLNDLFERGLITKETLTQMQQDVLKNRD